VVVTRGAIFSAEKTRPDFHEPAGFNIDVCRAVHAALDIPVILQGSIVDWGQAEWALGGFEDDPASAALCAGVEMTRAQIADPEVGRKLAGEHGDRIRPCTLCNQTCQVRDARNPIVTCVGEPSSGRETEDPDWYAPARQPRSGEVVGGGPAGLEVARVASIRGHDVTIVERTDRLGGMARIAGPHGPLVEWFEREIERLGVTVRNQFEHEFEHEFSRDVESGIVVVQATGSKPGERGFEISTEAVPVLDVAEVRAGSIELPDDGTIVVFDPIGGPIGVALAEDLADRAVLVTQDNIAGNELARTGDLAPANTRLAQRGVRIERRSLLRSVNVTGVVLEDRYSGLQRTIACAAVVDCGFRLPTDPLPGVTLQVGDAVAPRTVHEAILEARRVALAI
jgi:hypothetical protein